MNFLKPLHLILVLSLVPLIGCQTAGTTRPDEPTITSSKLDNQDCAIAAAKLTDDLINLVVAKGKLKSGANGQALVIVSQIVNSTGQHLNMNMITGKITIALDRTEKVQTFTTDKTAIVENDLDDFLKDRKVTQRPDYTLSGEIIQDRVTQGNTTENTYLFQMRLNSTVSRGMVWQGEEKIIKSSKRSRIGL